MEAQRPSLEEILQVLLEISQSNAWRLWRSYISSLLEAALDEMEEASNWEKFVEARGLVRSLRAQVDFAPMMIRETENLRREEQGVSDD